MISSVKKEEYNELFTTLQKNNIMTALCYSVDNWGGANNYTKLINILTSQFYKAKNSELINAKNNQKKYQNVLWQKNFSTREDFGNAKYSKRYENNKLIFTLQWGSTIDFGRKYTLPIIDPFDIVIMNVGTVPNHICSDCLKPGDQLAMPAFMFEWICNEYNDQQLVITFDAGVTIVSFVTAVGSVIKAPSIFRGISAVVNTVNFVRIIPPVEKVIAENLPPQALFGWHLLTIIADMDSPISSAIAGNSLSEIGNFIVMWDSFKLTNKYKELIKDSESLQEAETLIESIKQILEE